jgi:hypothetical protein
MAKRPLATDGGAGEGKQDNIEHHGWYENHRLNVATSLTCPFILGYEHLVIRCPSPSHAAIGSSTAHTGTDAATVTTDQLQDLSLLSVMILQKVVCIWKEVVLFCTFRFVRR